MIRSTAVAIAAIALACAVWLHLANAEPAAEAAGIGAFVLLLIGAVLPQRALGSARKRGGDASNGSGQ
jgi:hypothetical protein